MPSTRDIFIIPREELATFTKPNDFLIEPEAMGKDFRLTIYTPPNPSHRYVAGADFALGVEDRDYDTLVIADRNTDPIEQVAELEGRWGPDVFDRLVYVMLRFYQNAFLVGERQVGLPVLRSLYGVFKYRFLYFNRDEDSRGRRRTDCLGHAKFEGDPTIPELRKALRDDRFRIRSQRNAHQLEVFQWRPRRKGVEKTGELRDSDLKMGAPTGEFDDLVNADAYCWKGIMEVPRFHAEEEMCEPGKAGDTLGMRKALHEPPKNQPKSAFRGYGQPRT